MLLRVPYADDVAEIRQSLKPTIAETNSQNEGCGKIARRGAGVEAQVETRSKEDDMTELSISMRLLRTHPASTPGRRDGLPRSAQAATAALDCWFVFQFQGSRSATLLAG